MVNHSMTSSAWFPSQQLFYALGMGNLASIYSNIPEPGPNQISGLFTNTNLLGGGIFDNNLVDSTITRITEPVIDISDTIQDVGDSVSNLLNATADTTRLLGVGLGLAQIGLVLGVGYLAYKAIK